MEEVKTIDSKCCKELYVILNKLNLFYKLPENLQQYISNNQDLLYKYDFNVDLPLIYQIENEKTKSYLSYLFLKYINENIEERKLLLRKYEQNEVIYEKGLKEKYNPDDLFKKNIKIEHDEKDSSKVISNLPIQVKKERFYNKLINFIKRILHL